MGGFEVHRRNGTDGICFWIACEVVGALGAGGGKSHSGFYLKQRCE